MVFELEKVGKIFGEGEASRALGGSDNPVGSLEWTGASF